MIPTLTVPSITNVELKAIKRKSSDSKGYAVAHIPQLTGQPAQSTKDNCFYIRAGDQFTIAPYEFIQRMFASQDIPSIELVMPDSLLRFDDSEGNYHIPICLRNESFAVGREVVCTVEVKNPRVFPSIASTDELRDISKFNKDKKLYTGTLEKVLHKGFPTIIGDIIIKPSRSKTVLIEVVVFADRMIASVFLFKTYLYKKGPKRKLISQTSKY